MVEEFVLAAKIPSFSWIKGSKSTKKSIAAILSRPSYFRGLSSTSAMRFGRSSGTPVQLTKRKRLIFRTSSCRRNDRPTQRISIRWTTACGPFCKPGGPVLYATKVWSVGIGTDCRRRTCRPSLKISRHVWRCVSSPREVTSKPTEYVIVKTQYYCY